MLVKHFSKLIKLDDIFFKIGLFLLPSAFSFSSIFILGSLLIQTYKRKKLFFKDLLNLNNKIKLPEISMGMTNDYLDALDYKSTYLRIGTGIFGRRTN